MKSWQYEEKEESQFSSPFLARQNFNFLLLMCFSETSGLSDKLAVATLQGSFLAALKEHMEATYPDQKGRFAKLLLRLPALRDVCTKGYQYFLLVRAKLEGEVPMSTLLQEMFESARF